MAFTRVEFVVCDFGLRGAGEVNNAEQNPQIPSSSVSRSQEQEQESKRESPDFPAKPRHAVTPWVDVPMTASRVFPGLGPI
jgi:hypothetical protein